MTTGLFFRIFRRVVSNGQICKGLTKIEQVMVIVSWIASNQNLQYLKNFYLAKGLYNSYVVTIFS